MKQLQKDLIEKRMRQKEQEVQIMKQRFLTMVWIVDGVFAETYKYKDEESSSDEENDLVK